MGRSKIIKMKISAAVTSTITIHDHDTHVPRDRKMWVHYRIGSGKTHDRIIDFADFVGWMYETGRGVLHYDREDADGCVIAETAGGTYRYTFTRFLKECVTDELLISYLITL